MRTITQNIYTFQELTPKVQEKVLSNNRDILVDYDWWQNTITEDAKGTAELDITGFDFGYRRFINSKFTTSAKSSASRVISEHGETCTTYSIAKNFLSELAALELQEDTALTEVRLQELKDNYMEALSNEYLNILEREYEYLSSSEYAAEFMTDNDWEFYEDGRRYRS